MINAFRRESDISAVQKAPALPTEACRKNRARESNDAQPWPDSGDFAILVVDSFAPTAPDHA